MISEQPVSETESHKFWFGIISLFPDMFDAIFNYGITSRAVKQGLVETHICNPRAFTSDRHRTVDDRPYGGGPGMLMKMQPLVDAITSTKKAASEAGIEAKVIYLSPQGKPLKQPHVEQMAKQPGLILLAGRYEGIDERLITQQVDEQWSIGDYVLSGGELPAMVLMDAVIRQIPGALGHEQSAQQDSFSQGLLDYPHYTRPEQYQGMKVPEVLLSGHHEQIAKWRLKQALGRTWLTRPELIKARCLSGKEQQLLDEFIAELNH